VATLDPWDTILEGATALLDGLTGGSRSGRVVLRTARGWLAEFRSSGRTLTVQLSAPDTDLPSLLGDYHLALIYGAGFRPLGDEGRPRGFGKSLSLHEGFRWDEQTLREVVLETIGVLRFVFGVTDASTAALDDATRIGSGLPRPAIPRPKLRRRH
jgi:hypothetical protein